MMNRASKGAVNRDPDAAMSRAQDSAVQGAGTVKTGSTSVRRERIRRSHVRQRLILFLILAILLILCAIFARRLCRFDPNAQDLSMALKPPGPGHPLGTDRYGRDMLSRVIMGARVSILSTLVLICITSVFGTAVGVICGYAGGIIDTAVMRISDICLAFPGLVFALAIAAVLKGGMAGAVAALALIGWPKYSRVARSLTLSLKESEFVCAAKMAAGSGAHIIFRHILPNILGQILVTAMLDIGTMMMELAGLSFLNLGAQPPAAEWGSMMSGGRSMIQTYPWVILSPGLAIFISVAVFNLLGDCVRDYMDPGSR